MTEEHKKKIYTQLWHLAQKDREWLYYKGLTFNERQDLTNLLTDILEIARRDLGAKPIEEPKHKKNQKLLTIPWATPLKRGPSRGKYQNNYPDGLLVHWTAGHRNGLQNGNDWMRTSGMLYLLIDQYGELGQSNPLNEHGYHGGASKWPGITGNVSDDLIGVELQAGGMLDAQNRTDFGLMVPTNESVYIGKRKDNIQPGRYHIYTEAQVETLIKLCLWLKYNNEHFDFDKVLGHDEVAPSRKTDPGGALVIDGEVTTMPEFRALLKQKYKTYEP